MERNDQIRVGQDLSGQGGMRYGMRLFTGIDPTLTRSSSETSSITMSCEDWMRALMLSMMQLRTCGDVMGGDIPKHTILTARIARTILISV